MVHHHNTIIGTLGGTFFALVTLPPTPQLITTVVLASVGAIASLITTFICKKIYNFIKKKFIK